MVSTFSFYAANSSTEHFPLISCVKTLRYLVYYLGQRIRSLRTSGVATTTATSRLHINVQRVHLYTTDYHVYKQLYYSITLAIVVDVY